MILEGKVAGIINERDLVINKGAEAGVSEGMKFRVMEPEVPVKDPDTGEELGSINKEKIRVKVVEVHAKFSIGKTYETYVTNFSGEGESRSTVASDLMAAFGRFAPREEVTRVRTLRADSTTRLEPISEESSFVKVGDPVVQIEESTVF